jgi:hypothetical protein
MAQAYDAVIVGAGHNGLTCAQGRAVTDKKPQRNFAIAVAVDPHRCQVGKDGFDAHWEAGTCSTFFA